ncbi:biopolymer transporter ExbD [uncultured Alsobacter sp.]|uniref:ExbD/TolR family protein n=1 Tax=uncultured Alsobacter sp. TaxID=1748258 RepID=UPI0025D0BA89|nr:biopolymer transporter ExbD [uncultured Alsobacter sp.]
MSTAAAGTQGRRRRGGRRHRPMSEINMTPFIDVMLVLLIIFMVAAPLLTVGVPLDLPQTTAAALNVDKQPLKVSVAKDGKIYLMETPIKLDEIVPKLQAVAKTGQEERIYVFGDDTIAYGRVAEVMATITAAGYKRVALVTAPAQKK